MESLLKGVQYEDTNQGAHEFLINETHLKPSQKTKVIPDPYVEGVWKLKNVFDGVHVVDCIIYMSGYKEPFGDIRTYNDFETGQIK